MPRALTRMTASLVVLAASCLLSSCSPATVWKAQATSPDGRYAAIAQTLQNSGPGNAWVSTSVYLQQTNAPQTRVQVLGFSCDGPVPHPFTLDNAANAGGTIGMKMEWVAPRHLDVAYDGSKGSLNFQAVKLWDITISVRDLSARSPTKGRMVPQGGQGTTTHPPGSD